MIRVPRNDPTARAEVARRERKKLATPQTDPAPSSSSHEDDPDLTPPAKKVGQQLTLSVPANHAEFRRHIERGIRRQGFITPTERAAADGSRKGCEKSSHEERWQLPPGSGLVGSRSDLAANCPDTTDAATFNFLSQQWEIAARDADLKRQAMREAGKATSVFIREPLHHQPNRAPRCPPTRGDWRPLNEAKDRPLRSAMWRLRDGIRPLQQPRVQACGRAVIAPGGVGVIAREDGRVTLTGLAHCSSVWECPGCQMQILQARADQLKQAVQRHGPERVGMLTLTIRHGRGDDLARLRKDLSAAFRAFARHRRYKDWASEHGLIGRVRALEVTHGPNGWHPHLHVLMFWDAPLRTAWVQRDEGKRQIWDVEDAASLRELWQRCVARYVGEAHVPDDAHGLTTTMARDGEYIGKMGLELSDPALKKAARGHRSPWQIAASWAELYQKTAGLSDAARRAAVHQLRRERDAILWGVYCADMRGARRLHWSHGLKARLGVLDLTDADILADDEERDVADVQIATIPALVWKDVRDRHYGGLPAPLYLVQVAEREGAEAFRRALLEVAASK